MKTQKKVGVQFKVVAGNCYMYALPVSGVARAMSRSYTGREVSTLLIQGVGLTPDAHCTVSDVTYFVS